VISRQMFLFLVAGGIAAVVNFLSRIVLNWWMPYTAAIIVAYLLGMITAFVCNRLFVFIASSNRLHHQIFWFVVVNIVALLQTLVVSLLLADFAFPRAGFQWHPETVAHVIGVLVPVVTSYIGHKHLSFRSV